MKKRMWLLVILLTAVVIKMSVFEAYFLMNAEYQNIVIAFGIEFGIMILLSIIWYYIIAEE